MKDFVAILSAYSKTDSKSRKAALATVIRVKGSSYRSPGARMLITDDGKWYGSISGGCLEGDALRKARQVMQNNKALTVTYDTREESNQHLGISLGCNGIIDVLIEPVKENGYPLNLFSDFTSSKEPIALATIFSSHETNGEKLLLKSDGSTVSKFSNHDLNELVLEDLERVFNTRKSFTTQYELNEEVIDVFIELIQPSISVIIFGGGFDARPVSQLAKNLGWNVTVTDECTAHIAPIFFPAADKLSLCHRDFVDRDFDITPHTACVLMSHNYDYDRDVLRKLLKTETPYIGILGPRKRFDQMLKEFLEEDQLELSSYDLERIHSPIGLDIAAETADEIAVSIIAEIQAKLHGRTGSPLKHRNAPIHDRDSKSNQLLKQVHL